MTFLEEAAELLASSEQCFLNLEIAKDDPAIINQIFRLAHSLKGSAKAVGFDALGDFTHVFESFLLKLQRREIVISGEVISLLLECNDLLVRAIPMLRSDCQACLPYKGLRARLADYIEGREGMARAPAPSDRTRPAPSCTACPRPPSRSVPSKACRVF